jgi:hypothetical protein
MNVQPVKSAQGCRVRNPKTGDLLPNVADTDAAGVLVDLDDPYWFRSMAAQDIVTVNKPAAAASPAPATASATSADTAAPAVTTAAQATNTTSSAATAPAAKSA